MYTLRCTSGPSDSSPNHADRIGSKQYSPARNEMGSPSVESSTYCDAYATVWASSSLKPA